MPGRGDVSALPQDDFARRRAAELLSESNLSIVEIASAVGYNSASQFGVAFKRRYHLTPSQFRRMAHTQKFSS